MIEKFEPKPNLIYGESLVVSLMDTNKGTKSLKLKSCLILWWTEKGGVGGGGGKSFLTWETSALKYKHPSGLQISQQIPIKLQSNPSPPTRYIMKKSQLISGNLPTHHPSFPNPPPKVGYPLGHHHLSSPKGLLKHHTNFF